MGISLFVKSFLQVSDLVVGSRISLLCDVRSLESPFLSATYFSSNSVSLE